MDENIYLDISSECDEFNVADNVTADFGLQLSDTINKKFVRVLSVTIPYSFYNIRTGVNDTVMIIERIGPADVNQVEELITIPQGNYTINDVVSILNTSVSGGISGGSNTYSVSFNQNTGKILLTRASGTNAFSWERSDSIPADVRANEILGIGYGGFTNSDGTPYTGSGWPSYSSVTTPNIVNLKQITRLYLKSDGLCNPSVYNYQVKSLSKKEEIIAIIRVNASPFSTIDEGYTLGAQIVLRCRPNLSNIYFKLTDVDDNIVDLNNQHYSFTLAFSDNPF